MPDASPICWLRSLVPRSEAGLILVSIVVGAAAGLLAAVQSSLAHGLQQILFGLDLTRLSAAHAIEPLRLLALPFGGLILVGQSYLMRQRSAPVGGWTRNREQKIMDIPKLRARQPEA